MLKSETLCSERWSRGAGGGGLPGVLSMGSTSPPRWEQSYKGLSGVWEALRGVVGFAFPVQFKFPHRVSECVWAQQRDAAKLLCPPQLPEAAPQLLRGASQRWVWEAAQARGWPPLLPLHWEPPTLQWLSPPPHGEMACPLHVMAGVVHSSTGVALVLHAITWCPLVLQEVRAAALQQREWCVEEQDDGRTPSPHEKSQEQQRWWCCWEGVVLWEGGGVKGVQGEQQVPLPHEAAVAAVKPDEGWWWW